MTMTPRRRFTMHLTPRLDLLVIVLFAQYIDLQQLAEQEADRRVEAEQAQAASTKLSEDALSQVEGLRRELEIARAQSQDTEAVREAEARRAAREVQAVVEQLRDVLNIDRDFLDEALGAENAQDARKIADEFRAFRPDSAAGIVRHLRTTAELKKRVDVWEVHVADDNSVRVILAGEVAAEGEYFRTPDQVTNALARMAREQGEPKSLVTILLSWSDADRRTRSTVRDGLEGLVTLLKAQWPDKRIEVATLGYTPAPP